MKKFVIFSVILMFISCAEVKNNSPSETAKIVAESFFTKEKSVLKKNTTSEGYASLITVQNMLPDSDKDIKVEILEEKIDGKTAWVKYSTSYDGKTGVFKLTKDSGQWRVTSKGPREKGPF